MIANEIGVVLQDARCSGMTRMERVAHVAETILGATTRLGMERLPWGA